MTNIPTYHNVHHRFKLNGFPLDRDDLCRIAYSFIKEGDDYEKHCGLFLLDWFDDKTDIEINTSGTTGTPKTIRVSKQAMVNSALATGDFFDLQPGDKALHCLPTKYIAGKMMFVRGFILGLDMEFAAPSANPLKYDDQRYDFAALVPLQAENSLKRLGNIRKIIIGGAKINPMLEKKLEKVNSKIYETYGMTETITHIAAKQVGDSAFTVLPNVTISYDDNNCLVIHAPRISDDVIVTNDLVELVNENQFVFLGRRDNVVNSGGIKLIPEQIEAKLAGKINARFFVAGIPDETLGEKLVLFVEGKEQPMAEDVFAGLGKYEKPKEVRFVPHFTETGSGKIKRKEMQKQ
ncbi:AMP-binding protein [Flavobacterium sp. MAH-1]|uniref:AMP-binding protein n=1 Tax=Flavobacterium agri TaxID=2743471 RepID=A0A7Y9C4D1_9FLAO|nr:AMP-binding protein [Flavobacterium agri]NUY80026.1 AMP-binding protein [Flavobacterium agri]NYA70051.1 AMP-binding protein [Flavobacterium agri]